MSDQRIQGERNVSGRLRVTVISVFYNRADCVDTSVQSLLNQDYENLEIILVDDGSTDLTCERLQAYEVQGCRVISHENKGFVRALRDAVDAASGTLIAIHGSGDVSHRTRISQQVEFLTEHPEVVAVSCGARYINTVTGTEVVKCPQQTVFYAGLQDLRGKSPLVHGQAMFRRHDYDCVGGYRSFFVNAQDHDLWLRLVRRGALAVLPVVLYDNYSRSDGISQSPYKWAFQKVYGQIAVTCSEQREVHGVDEVELFSAGAALIRNHHPRLARLFAIRGIRSLAAGDVEAARYLCKFARRESKGSLMSMVLLLLLRVDGLRRGRGIAAARSLLGIRRKFSEPGAHW